MGDIIDMIFDGILCQVCGAVFPDVYTRRTYPSHPRTCASCLKEQNDEDIPTNPPTHLTHSPRV